MTAVDKAEVEREMLDAWQALASAVDSVSLEEMEHPGVVGEWSLKDLLGHIAFWAEKAAEDLGAVAAGEGQKIEAPENMEEVDKWNARERERRKGQPLSTIREEWLESFQKAMQALADFPEERLSEVVKGRAVLERFAGDTYEHYREHAEQIAAWRRELETTEA